MWPLTPTPPPPTFCSTPTPLYKFVCMYVEIQPAAHAVKKKLVCFAKRIPAPGFGGLLLLAAHCLLVTLKHLDLNKRSSKWCKNAIWCSKKGSAVENKMESQSEWPDGVKASTNADLSIKYTVWLEKMYFSYHFKLFKFYMNYLKIIYLFLNPSGFAQQFYLN